MPSTTTIFSRVGTVTHQPKQAVENESCIRQRLGIPDDARRVIVFAETSHWDPNWLCTSEEYFRFRIKRILDNALEQLDQEPKRVYSIECLFFLKMYWERCPEQQNRLRKYINNGRIRLTGSGMTTPDTNLPSTEVILRDYLRGQSWLHDNGMTQRPRMAYFPDGFGHSPAVPSLLEAAGIPYAAITRIDGMNFPGSDYRPGWYYPRPGSSASLLHDELKTLDFVWQGPDGSEVLCHWNPQTYFQGDNLVYLGPVKWMGILFGFPIRTERHIARRITQFEKQLDSISATPYLFCPIGMDFNGPIPGLHGLLNRYNRERYADTGTYLTIGALDDYLDLVSFHREKLPTLRLDPNPYWMGYYASRTELKIQCKQLVQDLLLEEKLRIVRENQSDIVDHTSTDYPDLTPAWDIAVVSNHHDFITGTAPDRVCNKEQRVWLKQADEFVKNAMRATAAALTKPVEQAHPNPPEWCQEDSVLEVTTPFMKLRLDEDKGGCLTSWKTPNGCEYMLGLGNDAVSYVDSGGLWRMGQEFAGGRFHIKERSSENVAAITVLKKESVLEVTIAGELEGVPLTRKLWIRNDSPVVRMQITGTPLRRRTVTVRFSADIEPASLIMDVPGGVVARPLTKLFVPTFWSAQSFLHFKDALRPHGLAAAVFAPASFSADSQGMLEWVAMRNTPSERAFRFLPIPAHPASGREDDLQTLDYAVWFTETGDWRDNRMAQTADAVLKPGWIDPNAALYDRMATRLIEVDSPDVRVDTVKKADDQRGLIVRLLSYAAQSQSVQVSIPGRKMKHAYKCTALEQDLHPLDVDNQTLTVEIKRHITTLRLIFD